MRSTCLIVLAIYAALAAAASHLEATEERSHADREALPGASAPFPLAKGMPNLGNTCYINSVMQAMAAIPTMARHHIMAYPVEEPAKRHRTVATGLVRPAPSFSNDENLPPLARKARYSLTADDLKSYARSHTLQERTPYGDLITQRQPLRSSDFAPLSSNRKLSHSAAYSSNGRPGYFYRVEEEDALPPSESTEKRRRHPVSAAFADVLSYLWSPWPHMMDTLLSESLARRLKSAMGTVDEKFSTSEQQDAEEFLSALINRLHEEQNKAPQRTTPPTQGCLSGPQAAEEYKSRNQSVVAGLFAGQEQSRIDCSCGHHSEKYDAFMIMNLAIPIGTALPEEATYDEDELGDCRSINGSDGTEDWEDPYEDYGCIIDLEKGYAPRMELDRMQEYTRKQSGTPHPYGASGHAALLSTDPGYAAGRNFSPPPGTLNCDSKDEESNTSRDGDDELDAYLFEVERMRQAPPLLVKQAPPRSIGAAYIHPMEEEYGNMQPPPTIFEPSPNQAALARLVQLDFEIEPSSHGLGYPPSWIDNDTQWTLDRSYPLAPATFDTIIEDPVMEDEGSREGPPSTLSWQRSFSPTRNVQGPSLDTQSLFRNDPRPSIQGREDPTNGVDPSTLAALRALCGQEAGHAAEQETAAGPNRSCKMPKRAAPPPIVTLEECLAHHMAPEKIDFACPACSVRHNAEDGSATKRISLSILPPILVVQLKRFIYQMVRLEDGSFVLNNERNNTPVSFSTTLDMKPFLQGEGPESSQASAASEQQPSTRYELFAAVLQFGSLSMGHYTAAIKCPRTGQWRHISDRDMEVVEDVSHSIAYEHIQRAAYLLFYRRITTPADGTSQAATAFDETASAASLEGNLTVPFDSHCAKMAGSEGKAGPLDETEAHPAIPADESRGQVVGGGATIQPITFTPGPATDSEWVRGGRTARKRNVEARDALGSFSKLLAHTAGAFESRRVLHPTRPIAGPIDGGRAPQA